MLPVKGSKKSTCPSPEPMQSSVPSLEKAHVHTCTSVSRNHRGWVGLGWRKQEQDDGRGTLDRNPLTPPLPLPVQPGIPLHPCCCEGFAAARQSRGSRCPLEGSTRHGTQSAGASPCSLPAHPASHNRVHRRRLHTSAVVRRCRQQGAIRGELHRYHRQLVALRAGIGPYRINGQPWHSPSHLPPPPGGSTLAPPAPSEAPIGPWGRPTDRPVG